MRIQTVHIQISTASHKQSTLIWLLSCVSVSAANIEPPKEDSSPFPYVQDYRYHYQIRPDPPEHYLHYL